jgi:hypothetical protein
LPPTGDVVEHSHNLLLDLLLWAGIPTGGLIIVLAAWALARQARALRDPRAAWLFAGVVGLLVHAMLEYPLEYAYFLLPAGLALGAAYALDPGEPGWRVPPTALRGVSAVLAGLFVVIAIDYLEAEQNHRLLRLESARIGTTRIESAPPQLMLLDQLQAFLTFARSEAREGMSPAELDAMRRVSERYAYPPVMFRYALASGLNGEPAIAALTLQRLCRMHSEARCREARELWPGLQQRYPQLAAIPAP